MKITVNFIDDVILAVMIAILPYADVIVMAFDKGINQLELFWKDMAAIIIVYIIAVIGLEKTEQKLKADGKKAALGYKLFILLAGELLIFGIFSLLGYYTNMHFFYNVFIPKVVYFAIFLWVIISFFMADKVSVLYLLPVLIYKIMVAIR